MESLVRHVALGITHQHAATPSTRTESRVAVHTHGAMISALELDEAALAERLTAMGEPAYRARQIRAHLLRRGVLDYGGMTDLPAAVRDRLDAELPATPLAVQERRPTPDGQTVKLLLRALDGELIEAVSIRDGGRHTVCVSSQVGCGMACAFCASGLDGVARNLSAAEMVAQVLHAGAHGEITNVVFMGMGEPLANFPRLVEAIGALTDPDGIGMGARRLTVSTVGLVPRIRDLAATGLSVGLAISLHGPDDETRRSLVPVADRYGVAELLDAARHYAAVTGRRVTYEYTLIAGRNAEPHHAHALGTLLAGTGSQVNLIPYNPVPGLPFSEPASDAVRRFAAIVAGHGVTVTTRKERGRRVDAACGQLRRTARAPAP